MGGSPGTGKREGYVPISALRENSRNKKHILTSTPHWNLHFLGGQVNRKFRKKPLFSRRRFALLPNCVECTYLSVNTAAKTQIWIPISVYVLLATVRKRFFNTEFRSVRDWRHLLIGLYGWLPWQPGTVLRRRMNSCLTGKNLPGETNYRWNCLHFPPLSGWNYSKNHKFSRMVGFLLASFPRKGKTRLEGKVF